MRKKNEIDYLIECYKKLSEGDRKLLISFAASLEEVRPEPLQAPCCSDLSP